MQYPSAMSPPILIAVIPPVVEFAGVFSYSSMNVCISDDGIDHGFDGGSFFAMPPVSIIVPNFYSTMNSSVNEEFMDCGFDGCAILIATIPQLIEFAGVFSFDFTSNQIQ
jgi:hypothetical protein